MISILKTSAIAIFAVSLSISAINTASAQQSGGKGGSPGHGGGLGVGGADEDTNKNPAKKVSTFRYIISIPDRTPGSNYPRQPRHEPIEMSESCGYLYTQINRSNMMKTVPAYQECLRENGS